MGEIADMMISGMLDYETGEYIGEGVGHPRRKRPEGVSKEDAKIKRVQADYNINYKAAKRVRKNMLISQERALKIKELEARVKELTHLADHNNGEVLLGWMDAHKKVCDERDALESRVKSLEELQNIVEYAAIHSESDEEFGTMIRRGCAEHKNENADCSAE